MKAPGEILTVNGRGFTVLRLLGRGKGGYSYLVSDGTGEYVIKQIHHEPCDYYSFGNKFEAELRDHETLLRVGVPMPRLIDFDPSNERILKEYVEGATVAERIGAGQFDPKWLARLREISAKLRQNGLNIDYYPTNFVPRGEELYYIDYECNGYMEEWDLEHWGLKFWTDGR